MEGTGRTNKPTIGTPNNVEILMHCYTSPEPHPRIHASAVKETLQYFTKEGVIEETSTAMVYRTTSKGEAWIKAILNTQMPKRAWIDEDGEVL